MELGIIANPASGKDIRRLVAHATVVDNNEKVNIVKRIVLAAGAAGVRSIGIMPDSFHIGLRVREELMVAEELRAEIEILPLPVTGSADDTKRAARYFREAGVGCVIVLGGDGTSRAAALELGETPLLPISTGTNNVYPQMTEGTIAGLTAAAFLKCRAVGACCHRDKRIEIYKGDELIDIALIDAVVSADQVAGARALWHSEDIRLVLCARARPGTIGFSALAAAYKTARPQDDFGLVTAPDDDAPKIMVPLAAGVVEALGIRRPMVLPLDEDFTYQATERSMIALDGEREISLKSGERVVFRLTRSGPVRLDVDCTLDYAQAQGIFIRAEKDYEEER